jgi:hypothetical protein
VLDDPIEHQVEVMARGGAVSLVDLVDCKSAAHEEVLGEVQTHVAEGRVFQIPQFEQLESVDSFR